MKKNFVIVFLIFMIPLCAYWVLTKDKITSLPSIAANGDEIIKFSSPMCYECQELEKVFEECFPQYSRNITLTRIDVTNNDKKTKELIKEYKVTLVPTTVFKNQDGRIIRRIEGSMQSKILDNYMKELTND